MHLYILVALSEMHCNLDIVPERSPDGANAANLGGHYSGHRLDTSFVPYMAVFLNLYRSAKAWALFAATP